MKNAESKSDNFKFADSESTAIFLAVTRTRNVSGALGQKMKISELRVEVYKAVRSLLIERARLTLERASMTPAEISRKCGNVGRDGTIDPDKFLASLKEHGLTLEPNMASLLVAELDPRAAAAGASRKAKITQAALRALFEACGSLSGGQGQRKITAASEEVKEQFGAGPSEEKPIPGISADELVAAKRAARKILAKCYNTIVETVAGLDHLEEGIVNK